VPQSGFAWRGTTDRTYDTARQGARYIDTDGHHREVVGFGALAVEGNSALRPWPEKNRCHAGAIVHERWKLCHSGEYYQKRRSTTVLHARTRVTSGAPPNGQRLLKAAPIGSVKLIGQCVLDVKNKSGLMKLP